MSNLKCKHLTNKLIPVKLN